MRPISHPATPFMPLARRQIVLLAMLALAGCSTPLHKGKSPLLPTQMSSDSVVFDIFFVRYPFGDSTVNEKLWDEIDEQHFSPDLRERLARNGFRIGLVSGQMPMEMSKLLELSDKPATGDAATEMKVEESRSQTTRHAPAPPASRRPPGRNHRVECLSGVARAWCASRAKSAVRPTTKPKAFSA